MYTFQEWLLTTTDHPGRHLGLPGRSLVTEETEMNASGGIPQGIFMSSDSEVQLWIDFRNLWINISIFMLLYFLSCCYSCCFYCLFGFSFFILFLLKIKSLTFVLAEWI